MEIERWHSFQAFSYCICYSQPLELCVSCLLNYSSSPLMLMEHDHQGPCTFTLISSSFPAIFINTYSSLLHTYISLYNYSSLELELSITLSTYKMGYLRLIFTLSLIFAFDILHVQARRLQSETPKPTQEKNGRAAENGKVMMEEQSTKAKKMELGEMKNLPPIPEILTPQTPGNFPFTPSLPIPQIPFTQQIPGNIPFLPPPFPIPQIPFTPPLEIPNFPPLPPFPTIPNFPPFPPFSIPNPFFSPPPA